MSDTNENANTNEKQFVPDEAVVRPLSKVLRGLPRPSSEVVVELAFERREVWDKLNKLENAIKANPEGVSDHHKDLWRKQAEAMRAYEEVLGERIKDSIDNE